MKIPWFGTVSSAWILVAFVILTPSTLAARELDHTELWDIAKVGKTLLRTYPGNQTVFIGVGQSPQVILAFLEGQLGPDRVHSVPLSSTRNLDLVARDLGVQDRLGEFMATHLLHFIPESAFTTERTFVVFDYSLSGGSFRATRHLFEEAFRHMGLNPNQLQFVALKSWHGEELDIAPHADRVMKIPRGLDSNLATREYRNFHPYSKLHLVDLLRQYFKKPPEDSTHGPKLHPDYESLLNDARLEMLQTERLRLVQTFRSSSVENPGFCWRWLSAIGLGGSRQKADQRP